MQTAFNSKCFVICECEMCYVYCSDISAVWCDKTMYVCVCETEPIFVTDGKWEGH